MTKPLLTTTVLLHFASTVACGGNGPPPSPQSDMASSGSDMTMPPPGPSTLSIKYESPLVVTDSLKINGMFLPVGAWTQDLCTPVAGKNVLNCDLGSAAGATSLVLSLESKGGGVTTYSCTEQPCGSRNYQERGILTVTKMGSPLMATLVDNQQGCGCNHEYKLR